MKLIIEEKQELVRTNIGIEKYEITDYKHIKIYSYVNIKNKPIQTIVSK